MPVPRQASSRLHWSLPPHKKPSLTVRQQSFGFITTSCQGHKLRCSRVMRSKSSSKINCLSPRPCTGMVCRYPPIKTATHRTACLRAKNASTDSLCPKAVPRSEEHTSELQSRGHLVCRLLLEK